MRLPATLLARMWKRARVGVKDRLIEALTGLASLATDRRPRTTDEFAASSPRRVLLIKTDRIGDLLTATPLMAAFRARWPEARLVLVGSPKTRSAMPLLPYLERAPLEFERHPAAWLRLASWLPRQGFDVAVSLRSEFTSAALMAAASRAPVRAALGASRTVAAFNLLLGTDEEHLLLRHWLAARALGVTLPHQRPVVEVPAAAVPEAERIVAAIGRREGTSLVGIGVPGRYNARHRRDALPAAELLEVVRRLAGTGATVLLFGFGRELEEARAIQAAVPDAAVMPPVAFPVLAATLQRVDLYISSYTGPLHLADGVGTATVAIGTPARHRDFRPLGPQHRRASADRVADLTAADVVAAAASALGARLAGVVAAR